MERQGKMLYTTEDDIKLVELVVNENPFRHPSRWRYIENVLKEITRKPVTAEEVEIRVTNLILSFRERYDELDQLLLKADNLERENIRRTKRERQGRNLYTKEDDIKLVELVVNENPFSHPSRWDYIAMVLEEKTGKPFTAMKVRRSVTNLIKRFRKRYEELDLLLLKADNLKREVGGGTIRPFIVDKHDDQKRSVSKMLLPYDEAVLLKSLADSPNDPMQTDPPAEQPKHRSAAFRKGTPYQRSIGIHCLLHGPGISIGEVSTTV